MDTEKPGAPTQTNTTIIQRGVLCCLSHHGAIFLHCHRKLFNSAPTETCKNSNTTSIRVYKVHHTNSQPALKPANKLNQFYRSVFFCNLQFAAKVPMLQRHTAVSRKITRWHTADTTVRDDTTNTVTKIPAYLKPSTKRRGQLKVMASHERQLSHCTLFRPDSQACSCCTSVVSQSEWHDTN